MGELLKENPDQKKVAYYDKKVKEHRRKADEYRAKAQACEDAEKQNRPIPKTWRPLTEPGQADRHAKRY